jgi:hypothetical protein
MGDRSNAETRRHGVRPGAARYEVAASPSDKAKDENGEEENAQAQDWR